MAHWFLLLDRFASCFFRDLEGGGYQSRLFRPRNWDEASFPTLPNQVLSRTLYHYAFFYWTKSVSYPHLCGVFQQSAMTKIMFVCEKTKKFNCALLAGQRDGLPPSCKQPCSLQLRDVARIDSDWRKGRRSPPGPCFRDLPLHRFPRKGKEKNGKRLLSLHWYKKGGGGQTQPIVPAGRKKVDC